MHLYMALCALEQIAKNAVKRVIVELLKFW